VNNNKSVKLFSEQVYQNTPGWTLDSSKMGYFKGFANDTSFNKLVNELQNINLDSLKYDKINCCDGSIITLIIYYNGKRKYLKSMVLPESTDSLVSTLYEISGTSNLTKIDKNDSTEFTFLKDH
jgi:hypothetical protein